MSSAKRWPFWVKANELISRSCGLAKPLQKLGHGWVITSTGKQWMWLLIHVSGVTTHDKVDSKEYFASVKCNEACQLDSYVGTNIQVPY